MNPQITDIEKNIFTSLHLFRSKPTWLDWVRKSIKNWYFLPNSSWGQWTKLNLQTDFLDNFNQILSEIFFYKNGESGSRWLSVFIKGVRKGSNNRNVQSSPHSFELAWKPVIKTYKSWYRPKVANSSRGNWSQTEYFRIKRRFISHKAIPLYWVFGKSFTKNFANLSFVHMVCFIAIDFL